MEYIKAFLENWALWVVLAATVAFVVNFIHNWFSKPTSQQIADLQEWLKWAVAQAEKALGSGTGELKLRMVYDSALSKFPWIKNFISFEIFKGYVDIALNWLEDELSQNSAVSSYIKGE